jgi:hydroxymethylbilane synthase
MSSPASPLRLGTRASPLAMAQADLVRDALCAAHGWDLAAVEIVAMTASGDKILDQSLADIGGKALWTKELDRALIEGKIDFAVHSMKDVETIRPEAVTIAAMLPRADVRDRLIGALSIAALPEGARIGTNSPRRSAQLKRARPDVEIVLFRGNVATRLAKLEAGEAGATLLAAAGLDRLGLAGVGVGIEIDEMLPAPAQGAVGIEARTNDAATRALLANINDTATMTCVLAERAFLAALGAGCHSPVAALAVMAGSTIQLCAELISPDGRECVSGEEWIASPGDAEGLAHELLGNASPALRALFIA